MCLKKVLRNVYYGHRHRHRLRLSHESEEIEFKKTTLSRIHEEVERGRNKQGYVNRESEGIRMMIKINHLTTVTSSYY